MKSIKKISKTVLLVLLTVGFSANVLEAYRLGSLKEDAEEKDRKLALRLQAEEDEYTKRFQEKQVVSDAKLAQEILTKEENRFLKEHVQKNQQKEEDANLALALSLQEEDRDDNAITTTREGFQTDYELAYARQRQIEEDASLALALSLQEEDRGGRAMIMQELLS